MAVMKWFASLLSAVAAGPAEQYLSEDFFPGMHILEAVGAGRFHVFPRGQKAEPRLLQLEGVSFRKDCERLEQFLALPPLEPLQLPWALFTPQGRPVADLRGLQESPLLFLLEIGQWMWPAVRVGFEHNVSDVHEGRVATLRTLSLRPVIFEVQNFMSDEETDQVMAFGAQQGLVSSKGQLNSADVKNRKSHTAFRTSKQAWLSNAMSPLIAELDERTARLTRIPAENNEPAQLLRYDEGAYYHSHMDWTELDFYPDQRHIWASSHLGHFDRIATVFWYLNDVAGGETVFPKHGQPICSPESKGGPKVRTCLGATDPDMASCEGFKVRPKRGSVVLWYNFLASGRGDRNALHAGCPVGTNLTKWSANKWVRNKAVGSPSQWIEGHPALQRFGWHGEDAEVGSCHISFKNDFEKQVALLWLSGSGSRELATIRRGGRLSQASYQGHRFQVKSEEQLSNEVTCAPGADFVVTSNLELLPAPESGEL